MLKVENLVVGYQKDKDVVKGVSLRLKEGEVSILLGPNGSGKSTLIKALVGAIKAKEGTITLDDTVLEKPSERSKAIAYVPQNASLPPLSVFETILMGRMPLFGFAPKKEDKEITLKTMEKLNLLPFASKRADMLSGGEAQKVMVARALVSSPKVIVFDEPTSNLDIQNQLLVVAAVKEVAKEGLMVLIAMHDINLALDMGHTFYCLKDGELLREGGEEIINEVLLKRLYGVDAEVHGEEGHKHIHFGRIHL